MSHQKGEANPRHQRTIDVVCNEIGSHGAIRQREQATPELIQAENVEERYGDDEDILFPWVFVRDSLEYSGQRVGEEEGSDEFDCIKDRSVCDCCASRCNLPSSTDAPSMFAAPVKARHGFCQLCSATRRSLKSSYGRQCKRGGQPWRAFANGLSTRKVKTQTFKEVNESKKKRRKTRSCCLEVGRRSGSDAVMCWGKEGAKNFLLSDRLN